MRSIRLADKLPSKNVQQEMSNTNLTDSPSGHSQVRVLPQLCFTVGKLTDSSILTRTRFHIVPAHFGFIEIALRNRWQFTSPPPWRYSPPF